MLVIPRITSFSTAKAMSAFRLLCIELDQRANHEAHGAVSVLTTNGDNCTSEQLLVIWNKLAEWAGVADSGELRGKLLYFFARAREREEKK